MNSAQLLPEESLIRTGDVDHADWNYRPILNHIQRLRFAMIVRLLPRSPVEDLLEVGYGSGVFMPELSPRTRSLWGVDIHPHAEAVRRQLERTGIKANLLSASAESIALLDHSFDAIVAVSALEFIDDISAAVRECRRLLRPDGCLVFVTPGVSPLLDAGLKLLTGASAKADYGSRRQELLPALERGFSTERALHFPSFMPFARLYSAYRMRIRS